MSTLVPILQGALDSLRVGDARGAQAILGQCAAPLPSSDGKMFVILPRTVWVTHLMGRGQLNEAADELETVIANLQVGLVHRENGLVPWVGP